MNFRNKSPRQRRKRAAGAGFCPAGAADWPAGPRCPCQSGFCPISGGTRFQAVAERVNQGLWFAAIAQSVEHVIRNDGVGGSNPSCGTSYPAEPH
jgi:hypothetical protein